MVKTAFSADHRRCFPTQLCPQALRLKTPWEDLDVQALIHQQPSATLVLGLLDFVHRGSCRGGDGDPCERRSRHRGAGCFAESGVLQLVEQCLVRDR